MPNRPRKYQKDGFFTYNGGWYVGLKRRPDGRFYSAKVPTKTFGKDPEKAIARFKAWLDEDESRKWSLDEIDWDSLMAADWGVLDDLVRLSETPQPFIEVKISRRSAYRRKKQDGEITGGGQIDCYTDPA